MSHKVGEIGLKLNVDGNSYKKQIQQFGNYGSNQLTNSFGGTFKTIGKMAVAAFSVKALVDFTASCLKLGSDLNEVQNVVDVSFPNMTNQVDSFAKNAITQFGMSELAAKKFMGSFGAMSRAYGFSEKEAAEMSETLTGLVGDVSSFYNIDQQDAYAKLSAVFTSETEALKHLGVVMTQNALDEYALANGYGKTTAKMTEQEKVALRFAFVQDQLKLATGDFVRTQDSWANQTRVLSLRFDQLKASLGKGFIAIFTPIVKGINWVLSNLQPLADSFASLFEMLTGTSSSSGSGGGGVLADTASDLSGATDSAGGLSNGLSDAGKSGEKAAKKIQKAFAKVDTINKLTFGNDSESDSDEGSGGGEGGGTSGDVAEDVKFPDQPSKEANIFSGIMDSILGEFKRLSELFKTGFEIGFGNSFENIERIKTSLGSIGKSIIAIFTDPDVLNVGREWLDGIYINMGKIVGSFARIGVDIATYITESIAKYLDKNKKFIKDKLVKMFEISIDFDNVLGDFSVFLADIGDVLSSPLATDIGSNLIEAIANGLVGGFVFIDRAAYDIIKCLIQPLLNNKDKILETISGMLEPIRTITGTIATAVTETMEKISTVYDLYLSPMFERIQSGLSTIVSAILDSYNTYIAPVVNSIATQFSAMWIEHIQPAIDGIIEGFGKFSELIGIVWEQFLAPFISWIAEKLAPIIATVLENIWSKFELVVSFISEKIKALTTIFQGICDFLSGVFTLNWDQTWTGIKEMFGGIWDLMKNKIQFIFGWISSFIKSTLNMIKTIWEGAWRNVSNFLGNIWDGLCSLVSSAINRVKDVIKSVLSIIRGIWEGMWNGLKNFVSNTWDFILGLFSSGGRIFSGVVGGIADVFKTIVNSIIGGINAVIAAPFNTINGLLNKIKNFSILGKRPFSGFWGYNPLPVPQIPRLAEGGYVKANQPQLAMIGDNRHQGEVVAPEGKMIDMINSALKMQKEQSSADGLDTIILLIKQLIDAVKNLVLKVDIDMKKMSILLENAQRERAMIGG